MSSSIYGLSIIIFMTLTMNTSTFCQKAEFSVPQMNKSEIIKVDLTTLIRDINKYDKKWIETKGDVTVIFETFAITPIENVNFKVSGYPAIWLDLDRRMKVNIEFLNGKTFILRGKINVNRKGHLGQYQGTLENIFFIKKE